VVWLAFPIVRLRKTKQVLGVAVKLMPLMVLLRMESL
jgi:hypothetical protein